MRASFFHNQHHTVQNLSFTINGKWPKISLFRTGRGWTNFSKRKYPFQSEIHRIFVRLILGYNIKQLNELLYAGTNVFFLKNPLKRNNSCVKSIVLLHKRQCVFIQLFVLSLPPPSFRGKWIRYSTIYFCMNKKK